MTELMGPKMPFQNGLPRRVQWWRSSKATRAEIGASDGDKQQNQDKAGSAESDHATRSRAISSSQKP